MNVPLGAVGGLSWAPLGALLEPSWSHLAASDGHRKRKGEKANIIGCPSAFAGFWLPGGLLGGLGGLLEPSWGGLGASWSILEAFLRHSVLS
eukprot:2606370-Pyramimonas_sp.AAC.1